MPMVQKQVRNSGVVDNLNWEKRLAGCEGKMNLALYKVWHTIGVYVLVAIQEATNSWIHNGFSRDNVKEVIVEACKLTHSNFDAKSNVYEEETSQD